MNANRTNMSRKQILAEKTSFQSRVTPLSDADTPAVTAEEGEMYNITLTQVANVYEGAYC